MNKLLGRWAAELQAWKMGRRLHPPPPPPAKGGLVLLFPTCCEHPKAEHAEADGTSHLSFIQLVGFGVLQCSPPPVPIRAVLGFRGLLLGQQPLLLFLSPATTSEVSPCASEAPWQWLSLLGGTQNSALAPSSALPRAWKAQLEAASSWDVMAKVAEVDVSWHCRAPR